MEVNTYSVDNNQSNTIDNNGHIFNYNLNVTKTKKKIIDGAIREPYTREEKKGCINLVFNDGAFKEVVLKAIVELKTSPIQFKVGDENVERITIDPRRELSGKHVDTKIEFKINCSKLVLHVYKSRQKITIQGSRCMWFVDNYLEPVESQF